MGVGSRSILHNSIAPDHDTDSPQNMRELTGHTGWKGKVSGTVHRMEWEDVDLAQKIDTMSHDAVIVTKQTRAHLVPAVKKAIALVTDEGGALSHAAILSREHKVPSVLGTKDATTVLQHGDRVEVDAENGIVRKI